MSATSLPSRSLLALAGRIAAYGLFAFLGLVGLGAVIAGISALAAGEPNPGSQIAAIVLGCLLLAICAGFFYVVRVFGPRNEARERRLLTLYPDSPWMRRADWAARRVTDRSGLALVGFMAVWCAGWWGAIALIGSVNKDKIIAAFHTSWGDAAAVIFIVLGGVAGLLALIGALRMWWTYGQATLAIDTLPGFIGEAFRGRVSVRLPAKPTNAIDVTLVCQRLVRLTRRTGGKSVTETTTDVRWSGSVSVAPSRLITAKGLTAIPIDIAIPAGQPECALDENGSGFRWILRVHGFMEGRPAMAFAFEVPVYARR